MRQQGYLQLQNAIDQIHPLSTSINEEFLSVWSLCEAKRKTILSHAEMIERTWYFNLFGSQHRYYQNEDGREVSIEFITKNQFGGNLESLLNQKPGKFTYQTITKSRLLVSKAKDLKMLMQKYIDIEILIRKILIIKIESLQEHIIDLQAYSAKEKCERFLSDSPQLHRNIPQKYIANHLGMHETNFSKYKKAWRR